MKAPKPKPELPRYSYTIPEVLRSVGCGRTRLFGEIKAGRLRVLKVGRRVMIRPEAIQEWLGACEQRPAAVGAKK